MTNNSLLIDQIPKELLEDDSFVFSGNIYSTIIQHAAPIPRQRTPFPAKNLNEVYTLIKQVIEDYERRENIAPEKSVTFTEEEPDYKSPGNVIITVSCVKREPGAYGVGRPMSSHATRNYTYTLREEIDDPENPGYKRAILGFFHDNEIKLTVHARTNKVANERALWFEGFMQEYSWYFTSQGVARLLFIKREADVVINTDGQKLYARPIHFFVRTETLRTISQKTLQQISVESMKDLTPTLLNT